VVVAKGDSKMKYEQRLAPTRARIISLGPSMSLISQQRIVVGDGLNAHVALHVRVDGYEYIYAGRYKKKMR
jgi:hypothetical protein